jgi:hypothetical protein
MAFPTRLLVGLLGHRSPARPPAGTQLPWLATCKLPRRGGHLLQYYPARGKRATTDARERDPPLAFVPTVRSTLTSVPMEIHCERARGSSSPAAGTVAEHRRESSTLASSTSVTSSSGMYALPLYSLLLHASSPGPW